MSRPHIVLSSPEVALGDGLCERRADDHLHLVPQRRGRVEAAVAVGGGGHQAHARAQAMRAAEISEET